MPDATILADFMLARATGLVDGLVVHAERMQHEPRAHRRPVLLGGRAARARRAPGLPRQEAYELVQRSARRSEARRRAPARRAASASCSAPTPTSPRGSTAAELDACFDLDHHLRHAPRDHRRALGGRHDVIDDAAARAARAHARRHAARSAAATLRRYDGKVRDNYTTRSGERMHRRHRSHQRVRRVLGTLPFKGQVLNQLAAYWFEQTERRRAEPHDRVPDPNVMIARECEPLPVEFVMRAYLTGVTSTSIWTHYENGARIFCGHALPDGMKKNQKLPKRDPHADHQGREGRPRRVGLARRDPRDGRASSRPTSTRRRDGARRSSPSARRDAAQARPHPRRHQVRVRPRRPTARSCFIDEIHTPDSSRYWYADDYEARFAKRRGAAQPRQGVRAPLARRAGLPRRRPAAADARRGPRRGGAPLHRSCELVTGRPSSPTPTSPSPASPPPSAYVRPRDLQYPLLGTGTRIAASQRNAVPVPHEWVLEIKPSSQACPPDMLWLLVLKLTFDENFATWTPSPPLPAPRRDLRASRALRRSLRASVRLPLRDSRGRRIDRAVEQLLADPGVRLRDCPPPAPPSRPDFALPARRDFYDEIVAALDDLIAQPPRGRRSLARSVPAACASRSRREEAARDRTRPGSRQASARTAASRATHQPATRRRRATAFAPARSASRTRRPPAASRRARASTAPGHAPSVRAAPNCAAWLGGS